MAIVEDQIRELCRSGKTSEAATAALEAYGPEVLGWLTAMTGSASEADDAFAAASEDLWRGLEAFRWECSLRAWLYTLGRHALLRHRKRAAERPQRRAQLPESLAIVASVRSRTAPWLRTEVKDKVALLRASLTEAQRELLVLRVDRDLSWDEIALILDEEGEPAKATARLRKRFQTIKDELRERARAEGLLDEES